MNSPNTVSSTKLLLPDSADWAKLCNADGEFQLAARHWSGGLRLCVGDAVAELGMADGAATAAAALAEDALSNEEAGVVELKGSDEFWEQMLAGSPPRFHTDLMAAVNTGSGLGRAGDALAYAQYYGAVMRAIELLRPQRKARTVPAPVANNAGALVFDAPKGRYVHLELDGLDHRIYFEEAGRGIPVLLQHTAGCHGSQWRHLMEDTRITDNFRLIAYDLPYHGKSLPPSEKEWWAERYLLNGEFLRSVPLKLSAALDLDQPVFVGCSVGGLLALDLAHKHADAFRAVVSVEGALNIAGSLEAVGDLWHPKVSNDYKARTMEGLMSPESPLPYVKETSYVYASGWPQSFIGDLNYYISDYDLREQAGEIDTSDVAVHILSGEYDHSGTSELGKEAHAAIAGSSWQEMKNVGHFPMSENPEAFISYLLPILETVLNDA